MDKDKEPDPKVKINETDLKVAVRSMQTLTEQLVEQRQDGYYRAKAEYENEALFKVIDKIVFQLIEAIKEE